MTVLNKRRHNNKTQVGKNETELEDLRKIPEKNQKEIEECERKLERLVKQKGEQEEELQRNYTVLEEQTKPLIEKRGKLQTELIELQTNVDKAKGSLLLSEKELNILKHDETAEVRKYTLLKGSYEDSEQSLQEKKVKLEELKERMPEIKKQMAEKNEKFQKLQHDDQKLSQQLMTIKAEVIIIIVHSKQLYN